MHNSILIIDNYQINALWYLQYIYSSKYHVLKKKKTWYHGILENGF